VAYEVQERNGIAAHGAITARAISTSGTICATEYICTTWLLSAVAGVLVGVVWNYSVTSIFTWSRR
jgi:hypothetical protein